MYMQIDLAMVTLHYPLVSQELTVPATPWGLPTISFLALPLTPGFSVLPLISVPYG